MKNIIKNSSEKGTSALSFIIVAAIVVVASFALYKMNAVAPGLPPEPVKPAALGTVVMPKEIKMEAVTKYAQGKNDGGQLIWVKATGKYPANTPFAEKAKKHVTDFVNGFVSEYGTPVVLDNSTEAIYTGEVKVSVSAGKKLLSYEYEDYRDEGGAHGNSLYTSETMDMNGKLYALKDLFLPNTEYLAAISRVTTKHFTEDPEIAYGQNDPFPSTGLNPTEENFKTFSISGDTIVFRFQTYQIGAHALGAPTYALSIDDPAIKNMIRPELFGR